MYRRYDDSQATLDLVRREMAMGEPLFEGRQRRFRLVAVSLFFALLAVSLYLFLHTRHVLDQARSRLEQPAQDADSVKIRQYNHQVEVLQEKMTVFIADSVETRLRLLEKNVAEGKVGDQEINGIEDLKRQLRMLENYAAGKGGRLTDYARLDHPRLQPAPGTAARGADEQLLAEMIQVKYLLYVSVASCGMVGFLIGGYWWQHANRRRGLPRDLVHLRLPSRAHDGRADDLGQ
jgi:hypothetical protein